MTNQEQLLYPERRACPECLFSIIDPLIERCPRCNSLIQRAEVNCRVCVHNAGCPVSMQRRKSGPGDMILGKK